MRGTFYVIPGKTGGRIALGGTYRFLEYWWTYRIGRHVSFRPVDILQFTVVLGRGGDGLNEVFGRKLFILANSPFSAV